MPALARQHSIVRNAFRASGVLCTVAIFILVLKLSGVFASLDNWVFDQFAILQSRFSVSPSDTLVIRTERELTPGEIKYFAEQITKMGADLSVFFDDRPAVASVIDRMENAIAISLARGEGIPALDGIRRGPDRNNRFTVLLSNHKGIDVPEDYRFDFTVARDEIPVLDFTRVLSDDLPENFVEGKIVLVGRDLLADRTIVTPVHRGTDALSPVLFHALIADSILRPGMIQPVSPYYSWGIGALGASGLLIWLRRRNFRGSLSVYFLIVVVILSSTEVLLIFTDQWMSPVDVSVLPGCVILAATHFREVAERDSLQETLRNLAVETKGLARKRSFSREKYTAWMMVEKTFFGAFSNGEGFALAHTGNGRLNPVSESGAGQCRKWFTESEMRPDAEPFSSALRNGSSMMGDRLTILPIRTPAKLAGFWVFDLTDQRTIADAKRYAERMAFYLERRKMKNHHEVPFGPDRPLHDQLATAIDSLEHCRKVLANALDCSREAVLVFDSLGVTEHVSQPSLELFATAGITFEGMSPLELIGQLTDISESEIRWGLRFVALHRKEVTLLTRDDLVPGRIFLIHLRPLEGPDATDNETSLPGLVVLIEDATEIANGSIVKDEFMERFHFQLNNDFEAILSAANLIIDPRVSPVEQTELLEVITEKVNEATDLFKETREHLQDKFSPEIVERFPIRFERIFEAARASIESKARKHQISLNQTMSNYLPLVLASPKALEDLLHGILLTLVQNATENSEISIVVSLVEESMTIVMKNRGFGMPEEQLRNLLETGAGGWDTLDTIGSARQTVEAWGGDLSVSSQVGRGIEFELKLATVL